MSDPQEDNDPDHYSELINDRSDAGGVHSNSGISNHAYYLLVNGGKNAGCGPNLSGHSHTADCDVTVAGIGLAKAEQIFYAGFTSLQVALADMLGKLATTAPGTKAGTDGGKKKKAAATRG